MTIWYVHRREDGTIASAHGEPMEGYAEEALDDATNTEIQQWWAAINAPVPELTPAEKLEKAGLTVAELRSLLGLS